MEKIIVHIDLNAFFVRAEEIKNPSLCNKPVAIGHLGRAGIVSTCSYEARKYGITSGMPMNVAKNKCPNLIIINEDFHFYRFLSTQFIMFVKSYTPLVEQMSIDECFADFTNVLNDNADIFKYFKNFQEELFKKTSLKCSIGIAKTKFLAKMGSDLKKPMGITQINEENISKLLFPLPIKNMFGIGKKTYPRLENIGVLTIKDLYTAIKNKDIEALKIIGSFAPTIIEWLECRGDDQIHLFEEEQKSMSVSSTLMEDTDNYYSITEKLNQLSKELAKKLKQEKLVGKTIQIMIKDTLYQSHLKSITINKYTNDAKIIYDVILKLYEKHFTDRLIRAVGISLSNLVSDKEIYIPLSLFDDENTISEEMITSDLIDDINKHFKKDVLVRASDIKKDLK